MKGNLAEIKRVVNKLRTEYQADLTKGEFSAAKINQIMNWPEIKRMGLDQKTLTEMIQRYSAIANQNLTIDQQTRELVGILLILLGIGLIVISSVVIGKRKSDGIDTGLIEQASGQLRVI